MSKGLVYVTSIKEVVGRNIKLYLNQHGMSQADLYRAIGSNSASINEWVKGKKMPEAESLEKIADVFCVPVSELFIDRYSLDNQSENVAALSYYDYLVSHPYAKEIVDIMMGFTSDELEYLYLNTKTMKRLVNNLRETKQHNKKEV